MTGQVQRALVVAGLTLALVALVPGLITAQTADGSSAEDPTVGTLAQESLAANGELRRASERADRRFAHVGGGAALGLGLGLVVGSLVSFQVWRARVR